MESLAPFSITAVTGMPGQIALVRRVSGWKTSGIGAGGAIGLRSGAVSETTYESETYFTASLSSAKIPINCLRISSGECPGKMRQFTIACAVWGRALLAWPALSRVATHVVLKFELKLGSALRRA